MDNEIDVKELRKKLGLTQQELANKLGVAEYTIRRWEKGQKRMHKVHQRQLARLERRVRNYK